MLNKMLYLKQQQMTYITVKSIKAACKMTLSASHN